jgi:hypothetical protein
VKILFALFGIFWLVAAHAAGALSEEQGAQELQKELNGLNKQAEDVLQQIDKLQALPVPGQPGTDLPQIPQMPNMANLPISGEQFNAIKERALKLANDDRFMKAAEAAWKSPDRQKLLLIQLGFFLFMILFKAFLQSRARHWFKALLVGFACTIFTWVSLSYAIPLFVLGEPFQIVTSTLFKVMVLGK